MSGMIYFLIIILMCLAVVIWGFLDLHRLERMSLQFEKVRKAKEDAEKADKAKSILLAHISHEIRTPINAILGFNELIAQKTDDSEILEYSDDLNTAGKTLLSLVNTILDFSKFKSGNYEIVNEKYSLADLIKQSLSAVRPQACKKGLEINLDVNAVVPGSYYGDELVIRQIAVNLLNNAVKYTDSGSVSLHVDFDRSVNELVMVVEDTGYGIRECDMDDLFKAFKILDAGKQPGVESTGLGLYIVSVLVHALKGKLNVNSTYGVGSEFEVRIPQKPAGDVYVGSLAELFDKKDLSAPVRPEKTLDARVLIVDDNTMNRKVIRKQLEQSGCKVDSATGGMDAVRICSGVKYDIIFMDDMMPDIRGFEALKYIRNGDSQKNRETPVIVLTANALRGSRQQYLDQGFDNYLSKPVSGEAVRAMAERYAGKDTDGTKSDPHQINHTADNLRTGLPAEINLDTAMKYTGNDAALVMDNFSVFSESIGNSVELLNSSYKNHDISRYHITVHGIKSNLKLIGAERLAENAYELEKAAGRKDLAGISLAHPEFVNAIYSLRESMSHYLAQNNGF